MSKMKFWLQVSTMFASVAFANFAHASQACHPTEFRDLISKYPTNRAKAAGPQVPFSKSSQVDLLGFSYYSQANNSSLSIDQYADRYCVTALLVMRNGRVLFEKYYRENGPNTKFFSASVSKSILAILIGIAIDEGKLSMSNKVVDIFPEFRSSAFGPATVEDLLRMSSGVKLINDYTTGVDSDNTSTSPLTNPNQNIYEYLKNKTESEARAGVTFHYNGAVTALLGLILSKSTGTTVTSYFESRIWGRLGPEDDAFWIKNRRGEEGVQGMFHATLRDYGRIGMLVANQGKHDGIQVIPTNWLRQMTELRRDKPQPKSPPYYGLHIWLPSFRPGSSQMAGVSGQFIFVEPKSQIVIVQMAAQRDAVGMDAAEFAPFRNALVNAIEKQPQR